MKHARYYWLLLAESHLTRRLFGCIVRRIAALPLQGRGGKQTGRKKEWDEEVYEKSLENKVVPGLPVAETGRTAHLLGRAEPNGMETRKKSTPMEAIRCMLGLPMMPKRKFCIGLIAARRLEL